MEEHNLLSPLVALILRYSSITKEVFSPSRPPEANAHQPDRCCYSSKPTASTSASKDWTGLHPAHHLQKLARWNWVKAHMGCATRMSPPSSLRGFGAQQSVCLGISQKTKLVRSVLRSAQTPRRDKLLLNPMLKSPLH